MALEAVRPRSIGQPGRVRGCGRTGHGGDRGQAGRAPPLRPAAQQKRPRKDDASRKPESRTGESPDRRWQAVIKDNNVWLRSAAGEEFALSTDGTADGACNGELFWSPDLAKLVAIRTAKGDDGQRPRPSRLWSSRRTHRSRSSPSIGRCRSFTGLTLPCS